MTDRQQIFQKGKQGSRIEKIIRPDHLEEMYICTTIGARVEIQDYSPELYGVLTNRKVTLGRGKDYKRELVTVQYGKGTEEHKTFNLSKFVLMFNEFFGLYKHMSGAVPCFIKAVPEIMEKCDFDCGHVDANSWNNTRYNIIPMASKTNRAMSDYVKDFRGRYDANAISLSSSEGNIILVELQNDERLYYIQCTTAEDYCDFQKQLLGKTSVMKNTSIKVVGDELLEIETPKQVRDKTGRKPLEDFSLERFWEWCEMRDRIQNLYEKDPARFYVWEKWNEKGINTQQAMFIAAFLSPV